jgi:acyl carrier protein
MDKSERQGVFMVTISELRLLVSEQLGLPLDEVTEDARLVEDLGAQSLDLVNLIAAVDDRFGFEIAEEKIQNIVTVIDIFTLIQSA